MTKPHLSRLEGESGRWYWQCESPECLHWGDSPAHAYDAWFAMRKTVMEKELSHSVQALIAEANAYAQRLRQKAMQGIEGGQG